MVRKLNESDDYIKISKDYDDLVLRSIQIAKEMGTEQIIFQSKDGFFGSILAKNGKPVSPLSDGDEVIGKIRLVNRAGKKDAVYVTDYPAKESIKRSRKYNVGKSIGESKRKMRESFDDWSEEQQLDNLKYVFDHLLEAWGDFSDVVLSAYVDNDLLDEIIVEDYPFDRSFEEVYIDVYNWLDDCIGRIVDKERNL